MKKWIQVIWVAVLVMLLGVTVAATDDALSGNCGKTSADILVWEFDPATATLKISGTGDMIDYYAFEGGTQPWGDYSIDKIIITEGVTSIGEYAFYKLDSASLTSIIIPASIKKIGGDALLSAAI